MASLSKNSIIVTDASKKVKKLGAFKVPVEVVPQAYQYVFNQMLILGGKAVQRIKDNEVFITDNGNFIIDADFGLIDDPAKLASALNQVDGLLAHGIFINLTSKVMMSTGDQIMVFE